MQDINVQVLGVTGRQTRNNKLVYEVATSDGNKYTTFEAALATKAQGFVGQQASLRIEISQSADGRFTNYNLRDIAGVGQLSAMAMPVPPGTQVAAQVQQTAQIPIVPAQQRQSGGGMPEETVARITKLACLSTAATLVAPYAGSEGLEHVADMVAEVGIVAQRLYGLARSHEGVAENPVEAPVTAPEVPDQSTPQPEW